MMVIMAIAMTEAIAGEVVVVVVKACWGGDVWRW